jgi:hypothetical protein
VIPPASRSSLDKQIGIAVPPAISGRLDALVLQARAAGYRTSRKELVCALIAAASHLGVQLNEAVRRLRLATVRDTVVADQDPTLVTEPRRRPGPLLSPADPGDLGGEPAQSDEAQLNRRLAEFEAVRMGLSVPRFIDRSLSSHVRHLPALGETTNRSELVAALILIAPESGEDLGELLEKLRTTHYARVTRRRRSPVGPADELNPTIAENAHEPDD